MRIKQLQEEDADEVAEVIKRALLQVNSKDYPKNLIENQLENYTPGRILEKAKESIMVVGIEDTIIGTGNVKENYISGVFVDPDCHNKGAGKEIMRYLESVVKQQGFEKIKLGASISAYGFYTRIGYTKVGEDDDPYVGRIFLMEKDL